MGNKCSCEEECGPGGAAAGGVFKKPQQLPAVPPDSARSGVPDTARTPGNEPADLRSTAQGSAPGFSDMQAAASPAREGMLVSGGSVKSDCGVVEVKTATGEDVWFVYRKATQRWVVVHSTDSNIPRGCTATYPQDADALAAQPEIKMRPPTWVPSVVPDEVAARVESMSSSQALQTEVQRLLEGKAQGSSFWVLLGAPAAGKTTWGKQDPDVMYDSCVQLCHDKVLAPLSGDLFQQLAVRRQGGLPDSNDREAFIVEAMGLGEEFAALAGKIMWDPSTGAFNAALKAGQMIVAEADGSQGTSEDLQAAVQEAKRQGYKVHLVHFQAMPAVLTGRQEDRFEKELATVIPLGARSFGTLLDRLNSQCEKLFKELMSQVDDWRQIGPDGAVVGNLRTPRVINPNDVFEFEVTLVPSPGKGLGLQLLTEESLDGVFVVGRHPRDGSPATDWNATQQAEGASQQMILRGDRVARINGQPCKKCLVVGAQGALTLSMERWPETHAARLSRTGAGDKLGMKVELVERVDGARILRIGEVRGGLLEAHNREMAAAGQRHRIASPGSEVVKVCDIENNPEDMMAALQQQQVHLVFRRPDPAVIDRLCQERNETEVVDDTGGDAARAG